MPYDLATLQPTLHYTIAATVPWRTRHLSFTTVSQYYMENHLEYILTTTTIPPEHQLTTTQLGQALHYPCENSLTTNSLSLPAVYRCREQLSASLCPLRIDTTTAILTTSFTTLDFCGTTRSTYRVLRYGVLFGMTADERYRATATVGRCVQCDGGQRLAQRDWGKLQGIHHSVLHNSLEAAHIHSHTHLEAVLERSASGGVLLQPYTPSTPMILYKAFVK